MNNTEKQFREYLKQYYKEIGQRGGLIKNQNMTPEQRKEHSRKMNNARKRVVDNSINKQK